MCTLAIYFREFPGVPIVVAANRDEFLDRPTRPPGWIPTAPHAFGGQDLRAGGTWLAVNRKGMIAALLNRHTGQPPDEARKSRGELPLQVLRFANATAARSWVEKEEARAYNPFNLLVADRHQAWVATNHGGEMTITTLSAGLHVLTNLDLDDPTCPRISGSWQEFASLRRNEPGASGFREALRSVLAKHDLPLDPRLPETSRSLCLHLSDYGTRSSTIVFLDDAERWTYWHTDTPPCQSPYRELSVSC